VNIFEGGSGDRAGTVLFLISIIKFLDGDLAAADTLDPGNMAVGSSVGLGNSTRLGRRVDGNAACLGLLFRQHNSGTRDRYSPVSQLHVPHYSKDSLVI
jgi:hypothetical protein